MWKDFFYYTRSEQRGIVILLILIVIFVVIRVLMPFLLLDQEFTVEEKAFLNQIKEINNNLDLDVAEVEKDSLFVFNPNTVSEKEMLMLGFSNYQIKSLLGYRNKVGSINSIDNLLKVYGVDSVFLKKYVQYIRFDKKIIEEKRDEVKEKEVQWIDFNELSRDFLKGHISSKDIRDSVELILKERYVIKMLPLYQIREFGDERILSWIFSNSKPRQINDKVDVLMDLNKVDTIQLKKIKGIGKVLSNRIVKYRKLLGGYVMVSQLKNVYGFSDLLYEDVQKYFIVDVSKVKKIRLDAGKIKEISKHPCFKYNQCVELINLCRKGVNVLDLKASDLNSINNDEWELMKKYIMVEVE